LKELTEIFKLSQRINKADDKIKGKWARFQIDYPRMLAKDLIIYRSYSALIRNSERASKENLLKLHNLFAKQSQKIKLSDELSQSNLSDKTCILVQINLDPRNPGTIKSISEEVEENLGWRSSEVIGKNIEIFLPEEVAQSHREILKTHLETGSSDILFKNKVAYVQHRLGYIIPALMHITPHPNLDEGFVYVTAICLVDMFEEILVVQEDGQIIATSKNLKEELGLSKKQNITQACPDFSKHLAAWAYPNGVEINNSSDPQKIQLQSLSSESIVEYDYKIEKHSVQTNTIILKLTKINVTQQPTKRKIRFIDEEILGESATMTKSADSLTYVQKLKPVLKKSSFMKFLPKDDDTFRSEDMSEFCNEDPEMIIQVPSAKSLAYAGLKHPKKQGPELSESPSSNQDIKSQTGHLDSKTETKDDPRKRLFEIALSSSTHSMASTRSFQRRIALEIEHTLQKKTYTPGIIRLLLIIFLYFCSSIAVYTWFNSYSTGLMYNTLNTSYAMRMTARRRNWLINLHRRAMSIVLVENEYMERYRYPDGQDYTQYCLNYIRTNLDEVDAANDVILGILSELQEGLRNTYFKRISFSPRLPEQETLFLPMQGIIQDIVASSIAILKRPSLTANDPDLHFIINNVNNELQIRSEAFISALFQHVQSINEMNTSINLAIIGIYCGFCLAIVMLSAFEEKKYVSEKASFFDSLLRTNEKECNQHAKQIRLFYKALKENNTRVDNRSKTNSNNSNKGHAKKSYRIGDFSGLYLSSYKRVLVTFLILLISIFVGFIFYNEVKNYNSSVVFLNERLLESQKMLIYYSLLLSALYQYVGNDVGATIKNVPVEKEIGNIIEYLKETQKFYIKYRELDPPLQNDLFELIQGNLCNIFTNHMEPYDNCQTLIKGSITKGLFSINSFVLNTIIEAKDRYEASAKTKVDIQGVFADPDLKEVERAFVPLMRDVYMSINQRLLTEIQDRIHSVNNNTNYLNFILIIVCVLMLLIGYRYLYRQAHDERYEMKRILTLLPIKIILANNQLKYYLKTYYDLSSKQI